MFLSIVNRSPLFLLLLQKALIFPSVLVYTSPWENRPQKSARKAGENKLTLPCGRRQSLKSENSRPLVKVRYVFSSAIDACENRYVKKGYAHARPLGRRSTAPPEQPANPGNKTFAYFLDRHRLSLFRAYLDTCRNVRGKTLHSLWRQRILSYVYAVAYIA